MEEEVNESKQKSSQVEVSELCIHSLYVTCQPKTGLIFNVAVCFYE